MESVLNNQKNIIASEEVSKGLEKNEPLTEQGQSPAILTEINDKLLPKTDEEGKSELEKTSEASKPVDIQSPANNDRQSESNVIKSSDVEQNEAKDKPEVAIENTKDVEERDAQPLLGFVSENPITVNNGEDEEIEAKETSEIKQDKIKTDVENLDDSKESSDNQPKSSENQSVKDEPKDAIDNRLRLSGAARKRYKWLLEKGFTPDEARELAPKSMPECRSAIQRARNPPKSGRLRTKKRKFKEGPEYPEPPKKYKKEYDPERTPKPVRFAILPNDYPDELLTPEQVPQIQSGILEKIVSEGNEVKPKFFGTEFQEGYMVIICADRSTTNWLKPTIRTLKPWPDASLVAIPEWDIPIVRIMIAHLANSTDDSNEKILDYIGAQNEGLDTTKWSVRRREDEKDGLIRMFFLVDNECVKTLKARDYKINYKFDQISLAPKGRLLKQRFEYDMPSKKPKRQRRKRNRRDNEDSRPQFEDTSPRFENPSPRLEKPSTRFEKPSPRFERPSPRFERESMSRNARDSSSRYNPYNTKQVGHTSRANPSIFDRGY